MNSVTVSLPDDAHTFVEAQAVAGGFASTESYIQGLIRAEQMRKTPEKLEAQLTEGSDTGEPVPVTEDWADLRHELDERIETQLLEGLNSPSEDVNADWWDRFGAELRSQPVARNVEAILRKER